MIEGLSHLTFVVKNLEQTKRLLVDVLGGKEVYDSAGKNFSVAREKFFELGGIWIAAMEGDSVLERSYNHVAFKVADDDLPRLQTAIEKLGLSIREARSRIAGEGQSLYFYDFDNHLFELHTGTLPERLTAYASSR